MPSAQPNTNKKKGQKAADQAGPDGIPAGQEIEAKIIEEQIGPGLRSIYSNVLDEDLPDDLLAIVDAMETAKSPALQSKPEEGNADE